MRLSRSGPVGMLRWKSGIARTAWTLWPALPPSWTVWQRRCLVVRPPLTQSDQRGVGSGKASEGSSELLPHGSGCPSGRLAISPRGHWRGIQRRTNLGRDGNADLCGSGTVVACQNTIAARKDPVTNQRQACLIGYATIGRPEPHGIYAR